jgi:thermolysin
MTAGGQEWNYLAGALDVVAHELTHGITDFTSRLIYENESGALNESFSDMMGTAVEFYYQPPGSGPMRGDYLIAEDVVTPGGIRSMADPAAYGQPDHYSNRAILPLSRDNGGVHVNSGIPNQVYYLAIEGGTNRTSRLSVDGVGFSNREQIEKVMYRAFTQMMPADATFATARAVTIQAAVDLYGANSPAARAVTQAWTAVGVN